MIGRSPSILPCPHGIRILLCYVQLCPECLMLTRRTVPDGNLLLHLTSSPSHPRARINSVNDPVCPVVATMTSSPSRCSPVASLNPTSPFFYWVAVCPHVLSVYVRPWCCGS